MCVYIHIYIYIYICAKCLPFLSFWQSSPWNNLNYLTLFIRAFSFWFSSVQSLSRVRLFATPWITAHQASLSITISWSSLRLTSIESVMPSSHLILCRPLLLLPPVSPSIRVFSNESTLPMKWPKYWSFSFSIIPSKAVNYLTVFSLLIRTDFQKEYNQSDFCVDHLVMSMCRVFSCVVGRGCLLWPVRSLGKTHVWMWELDCEES